MNNYFKRAGAIFAILLAILIVVSILVAKKLHFLVFINFATLVGGFFFLVLLALGVSAFVSYKLKRNTEKPKKQPKDDGFSDTLVAIFTTGKESSQLISVWEKRLGESAYYYAYASMSTSFFPLGFWFKMDESAESLSTLITKIRVKRHPHIKYISDATGSGLDHFNVAVKARSGDKGKIEYLEVMLFSEAEGIQLHQETIVSMSLAAVKANLKDGKFRKVKIYDSVRSLIDYQKMLQLSQE